MATYTKKEFAQLCNFGTNQLAVDIKRGKVVLRQDGMIDSKNAKNQLYLEKKFGRLDLIPKKGVSDSPKPVKPAKPQKPEKPQEPVDEEDQAEPSLRELLKDDSISDMSYAALEKVYKFRQGEALKKRIEKDQLSIDKLKGTVIPSELVQPVFLQHNQHILMAQKNADEEMLTAFAHKYSIPADDVAVIRGEWIKQRNAAVQKATEASVKGVTAIIRDYAEKRGVGEKA